MFLGGGVGSLGGVGASLGLVGVLGFACSVRGVEGSLSCTVVSCLGVVLGVDLVFLEAL